MRKPYKDSECIVRVNVQCLEVIFDGTEITLCSFTSSLFSSTNCISFHRVLWHFDYDLDTQKSWTVFLIIRHYWVSCPSRCAPEARPELSEIAYKLENRNHHHLCADPIHQERLWNAAYVGDAVCFRTEHLQSQVCAILIH